MEKLMLFLILFLGKVALSENKCLSPLELVDIQKQELLVKGMVDRAKTALPERTFNDSEINVFKKFSSRKMENYTLNDLKEIRRELRGSGFTKEEIETLEHANLLPKSAIHFDSPIPTKVSIKEVEYLKIDSGLIKEIKNGTKVTYVVDSSGSLKLSKNFSELEKNSIWYSKEKNAGNSELALVKEMGVLSYDSTRKLFSLKPQYSIDVSSIEKKEIADQVKQIFNVNKVNLLDDARFTGSKALDCLELMSAQSHGKNFILDRFISDNAVLATAVISSEYLGANRLNNKDGIDVVKADFIGTNINAALNASLGRHLVINNAGAITSLAARSATAMGMIELQRNVYNQVLENNAEERASNIANFDRAHFVGRLFINHSFDKFLVNKLPEIVYNACKKNSKTKIFISPRSVRIYERFGSAMLYYGLRKMVVSE